MTTGEQVRGLGFWASDRLKGGRVRRHLAELEELERDAERRERVTQARLEALLEHAAATTLHYAPFRGVRRLEDFPVLRKKQIQCAYDSFVSSAFSRSDLTRITTSGSYGAPLAIFASKEKRARQFADLIHFTGWIGWKIGMPYVQFRSKPHGRLHQFVINERILDPTHLSADWLRQGRHALLGSSARFVLGYPSGAHALADYCREQGDTPASFRLLGACLGGEPLTGTARRAIEEVFGCPVRSRYATNELGVLGQETLEEPGRHVLNASSFRYELLDVERDEPARPGRLGRIVVTDLFSDAFPLIRYETGDLGVLAEEPQPGSGLPVLERLEGRQMDQIFDPAGAPLCSITVFGLLEPVRGLRQFQLVQTAASKYVMRCVVQPGANPDARVHDLVRSVLGPKADIVVERVAEIAPLRSGKRPAILNRMPEHESLAR